METSGVPEPRVLMVEPAEELRETLTIALREEGYLPFAATSYEAAHDLLDTQTFEFVLADLFVGSVQPGMEQAHKLQRRAEPTPVGLLTTQKLSAEEVQAQGFVFLAQMPFDLGELLGLIAANMRRAFTREQARQANLLERVFAALNSRDLDTAVSFYSEDVVYYPVRYFLLRGVKKVQGRAALRAYFEQLFALLPDLRFEEVLMYGRPKGLAARYICRWSAQDGAQQQLTATTLFHFLGDQIMQVGAWMNLARLGQLLEGFNGG
jgi:DNA-binding response OmpR family regulator